MTVDLVGIAPLAVVRHSGEICDHAQPRPWDTCDPFERFFPGREAACCVSTRGMTWENMRVAAKWQQSCNLITGRPAILAPLIES
jgi:hypothetical protein